MSKDAAKMKTKLPDGALKLELFGDLLKISKVQPGSSLPVKKYEEFCIAMTERPKDERILLYKYLCGLALTAHARRTTQEAPRKVIYDVKNELFLSIVNNFANRKVLNFRLCVSPRFKVVEYCDACITANSAAQTPRREWSFCKKCKVDRGYYNVLSAFHRYDRGSAALFLGQELLGRVHPIREVKKTKLDKVKEELVYGRFHFSPANLQVLRLDSLLAVSEKLLKLAPAKLTVDTDKSKPAGRSESTAKAPPPQRRPDRGARSNLKQPATQTRISAARLSSGSR